MYILPWSIQHNPLYRHQTSFRTCMAATPRSHLLPSGNQQKLTKTRRSWKADERKNRISWTKRDRLTFFGNGPRWFFCQMSFQLVLRRDTAQFLQAKQTRLPAIFFSYVGCLHLFSHFQLNVASNKTFTQLKWSNPSKASRIEQFLFVSSLAIFGMQSLPWLHWKWTMALCCILLQSTSQAASCFMSSS